MRIALVAAAVLAVGCGKLIGIDDFQLAKDASGSAADGKLDTLDGSVCLGSGLLGMVCFQTPPSMPVTLTSSSIDTDSAGTCTQMIGNVCAVVGTTVTVSGSAQVTGSHPLALIATDAITIDGTLDASSTSIDPARTGAGANPAICPANAGVGNANEGGGGGAGGSFGQTGGAGGPNNKNNNAGVAGAPLTPTIVEGGCHGGNGGDGSTAGNGGPGGAGGGAIYLLARTEIHVSMSGALFASGAAGKGSQPTKAAGGGGGAGGLVGLEAATITIDGVIATNGGGGGGGGDASHGYAGTDGTTTTPTTCAAGGLSEGTMHGGPGGAGGCGTTAAVAGTMAPCCGGGGGGGGSVGIVWAKGAVTATGTVSPPVQLH